MSETVVLYRPVGPGGLTLAEAAAVRAFPPRLSKQPIFYPGTNGAYAIQIARDWNTKVGAKIGFIAGFEVLATHCDRYEPKIVSERLYEKCWIAAEELDASGTAIVREIEDIHRFEETDRFACEEGQTADA